MNFCPIILFWVLVAFLVTPALAQQQAAPTAEQQALGATILSLTQDGVALRTQIFTLQGEIDRLKAAQAADKPAKPETAK